MKPKSRETEPEAAHPVIRRQRRRRVRIDASCPSVRIGAWPSSRRSGFARTASESLRSSGCRTTTVPPGRTTRANSASTACHRRPARARRSVARAARQTGRWSRPRPPLRRPAAAGSRPRRRHQPRAHSRAPRARASSSISMPKRSSPCGALLAARCRSRRTGRAGGRPVPLPLARGRRRCSGARAGALDRTTAARTHVRRGQSHSGTEVSASSLEYPNLELRRVAHAPAGSPA